MGIRRVVYLPMTADIITPGHIGVIKKCYRYGDVIIGLLTPQALKRYKKVIMTYAERHEILNAIKWVSKVMPQNGLNCYGNLMRCQANYLASGDGFEPQEIESAKMAGCKLLDVRLVGEKRGIKKYSSTNIKSRIRRRCAEEYNKNRGTVP
jgi:cytidyltransferase-like protein